MKRILTLGLVLFLVLLAFGAGWLGGRTGLIGRRVDPATLPEHERRFDERMDNVALVGRFTVTGREDRAASPDRYEISSVEKVGENQWRFNAKIGELGVTMPVVVPIEWAGDTPVITMTNLALPGLGTFTVRVFFYGDRYAGTWEDSRAGGHMFGRIVPAGAAE
jgi:hypothetical protein